MNEWIRTKVAVRKRTILKSQCSSTTQMVVPDEGQRGLPLKEALKTARRDSVLERSDANHVRI